MSKVEDIQLLVVEDEPELREAMVEYLHFDGFHCQGIGSLREAHQWLDKQTPDILVLDLGLSDGDGLTLLDDPRLSQVGVIITTARSRPEDRLSGVRKGADAYLVKPIQLEELSMVIRNLHQRLRVREISEPRFGWKLRRIQWTLISPNGISLVLTRSEMLVLTEIAKAVGTGASRKALISCLGQNPETYDWRRMEILVRRLRKKCQSAFEIELPLRTVHGYGYAFVESIDLE
jgi:DNA-binding response OmpR family regulator